jgi:hypothetical protein
MTAAPQEHEATPIHVADEEVTLFIDGQRRTFAAGETLPIPIAWLVKASPIKYTTRYGRHPRG